MKRARLPSKTNFLGKKIGRPFFGSVMHAPIAVDFYKDYLLFVQLKIEVNKVLCIWHLK
jgi:hypothetical protein